MARTFSDVHTGRVIHDSPAIRVRRRPGRPRGGQHVVDRQLVLEAAERAIRRDGPGVSLETIALEAGVTKPIVYARVGGRTELGNALAQRMADRITTAVAGAITDQPQGRESLVAFIRTNLETVAADRDLFLYVTGGTADESPMRALYLAGRSAAPLAEQLAAWRTAQGLDPVVAIPWAYGIIGMLNLVSLWWIDEADRPAGELAEQLTELLWSGFAAP